MNKAWIIGSSGQLGNYLCEQLGPRAQGFDRAQLNLTDLEGLSRALERGEAPSVLINATAYNRVDQAETDRAACLHLNVEVPRALARWCAGHGTRFVHFSSDYVYDGSGVRPWTEEDTPAPVCFYGHSKWLGEQAVREQNPKALVFRTSWVYSHRRENFVLSILKKAETQKELTVVTDQVGNPTYADGLASNTIEILANGKAAGVAGVFNLADQGHVSRFYFAKAILKYAAAYNPRLAEVTVREAKVADFKTPAMRPLNTRLNLEKVKTTFGIELAPWQDHLQECLRRYYADH